MPPIEWACSGGHGVPWDQRQCSLCGSYQLFVTPIEVADDVFTYHPLRAAYLEHVLVQAVTTTRQPTLNEKASEALLVLPVVVNKLLPVSNMGLTDATLVAHLCTDGQAKHWEPEIHQLPIRLREGSLLPSGMKISIPRQRDNKPHLTYIPLVTYYKPSGRLVARIVPGSGIEPIAIFARMADYQNFLNRLGPLHFNNMQQFYAAVCPQSPDSVLDFNAFQSFVPVPLSSPPIRRSLCTLCQRYGHALADHCRSCNECGALHSGLCTRCFNCGLLGHSQATCTTCMKCGTEGHVPRFCPWN